MIPNEKKMTLTKRLKVFTRHKLTVVISAQEADNGVLVFIVNAVNQNNQSLEKPIAGQSLMVCLDVLEDICRKSGAFGNEKKPVLYAPGGGIIH